MNIFERIQPKQGLENYCTEILVGILEKDGVLLQKFCSGVLKISNLPNDDSLEIKSQVYYKGINDDEEQNVVDIIILENSDWKKKSVVDIVISGTNFLCFLEMKVESSQQKKQLSKYNGVLEKLEKTTKETKYYLRFCTKYNENISSCDKEKFSTKKEYFNQLRWYDISSFLKDSNPNPLINEFLEFLTLNNMDDKQLNYDEGTALKFYENFMVFEMILKDVKKEIYQIQILNDSFKFKTYPDLDFRLKRYGLSIPFHPEYIIKPLWSNIFVGFEFKVDGIFKVIWLWSGDIENSKLNNYSFIHQDNAHQKGKDGLRVIAKLKMEEKISDITSWFINELQNIQEIKTN